MVRRSAIKARTRHQPTTRPGSNRSRAGKTPTRVNPSLLAAAGVGPDTAAALLIAAGDNPHRLNSEASFAALCGASPVQASSGQTIRHRLKPRREPSSQQRTLANCHHPDAHQPTHSGVRSETSIRWKNPPRDHPLSQTPHRPRDLSPAHQPATNTQHRPPTHPTPERPDHPHPRRRSSPNPSHPPLQTREKTTPRPPTRHHIPTLAPNPSRFGINRSIIGASPLWEGHLESATVPTEPTEEEQPGASAEPADDLL